jgi:hypothetical protein
MTHGRNVKGRINRRTEKEASPLTGFSKQTETMLESRVARLEARVDALQEELNRASGAMPSSIQEAISRTGKKRSGPQGKIDETELLQYRDNLVEWLEQHWPSIAKPLLAARNPRELAELFGKIAVEKNIRPEWQVRFAGHPDALFDFLRSEKFRRKPPTKTIKDALRNVDPAIRQRAANRLPTRQIANAMAGVPELRWRTSSDKCSKSPSTFRVGYQADMYYRTMFNGPPEDGSLDEKQTAKVLPTHKKRC